MIITITGKPCSGKGTAGKLFCEKYNFEYISTGNMNRALAKEFGFKNVIDLQKSDKINEVDRIIDSQLVEMGKTRSGENLLFDSRLAWHFIPRSFKVYIDIDWTIAGERLLNSNRELENNFSSIEEATKALQDRFDTENERYQRKYGVNNLNLNNYDFVISSNNKTPEEIADEIYKNYQIFIKKAQN